MGPRICSSTVLYVLKSLIFVQGHKTVSFESIFGRNKRKTKKKKVWSPALTSHATIMDEKVDRVDLIELE